MMASVLCGLLIPFVFSCALYPQGAPSPEEQIIFELLLPKDTNSLCVRPKLEAYEIENPKALWAIFSRADRGTRTPGLKIKPYRTAFYDLIKKLGTHKSLKQWSDTILIREDSTFVDERDQSVFWFSPIGFNNQHTLAIVYRGASIGAEAGSGDYFFLRKQGNNWIIDGKIMMWIS